MESILILIVAGTLNIACFFIGAKVGQKVVKGEEIKAPEISFTNPLQEYRKRKQNEAEQTKIDTIMRNIESYNGTEYGQKDVL